MDSIGMAEMQQVFAVIDDLGISRESIRVPLLPAGPGGLRRLADGRFEITLPADRPLTEWLPVLRRELARLAPPGEEP